MLRECTGVIYENIELSAENDRKFGSVFRSIAGNSLAECKDFNGVLSSYGIYVNGQNEDLTREVYLNTMLLLSAEEGEELVLSSDKAGILSRIQGNPYKVVSIEELVQTVNDSLGINSYIEEFKDDEESYDYIDEEDDIVESDDNKEVTEEYIEESNTCDEEEVSSVNSDESAIKRYYYQLYSGLVNELSKRYTSLFESGYEVIKPEGILSETGLLSLSGSSLKERNNVAIRNIYNVFANRMNFVVSEDRSNVKIANLIYREYKGSRRLIYFPYKLVEYAFGRKAPTGDNQNSKNTYEIHSKASNWHAYCESEVKRSLLKVVESSVAQFVIRSSEESGLDYYNDSIASELKRYLIYLQECLSLCLLMVEYKSKEREYGESVYSFKVRICDPMNSLEDNDMTGYIISEAFMGSTGEVPFTYEPRFEWNTLVKEYAHEFNHNSSQASPLFAYKAFLALQQQNVEPKWNNMVLGMFEDGTILKNGKHGVALENRLTHHMVAGSRAGKGVMTLNILASGIYSDKNVFYLDRKPDMASLFKSIAPSMFVVNGGGYGEQYDTFKQFNNIDSMVNWSNVPNYVCEALGCSRSWDELGDLFYMRALKLVMGIIVARGDGQMDNPAFGGKEGILLVVDEFKNFQESYSVLVEKFMSRIPPCTYSADLIKLENDKIEPNKFEKSYNDANFYSLTYINSLVGDLEYLSTKRDAGFNQAEIAMSDIFVIGQHLGYGDLDFRKIRSAVADATSSDRYRSAGSNGLKGQIMAQNESFPYSMVGFKTCDAFFGRNMEDGRSVYLAQTDSKSKAYGRLDDKASNFAYMGTFTDSIRKDIVSGNVSKNVEMANGCTFFKPFLVLNDSIKGGHCVEGMFARCAGPNPDDPWITREELIAENPNGDGSYVNEAVGFEDYLRMMGVHDYSERLGKSGNIANYVVQKCLGYPGNWFEFITDLRPQWCFTIKDIVDGAKGIDIALSDPLRNNVTTEFANFNPSIFGLSGDDLDSYADFGDDSLLSEEDFEREEDIRNYEMKKVFEGNTSDEVDISDLLNDNTPIDLDDMYTPIMEGRIEESNSGGSGLEFGNEDAIPVDQMVRNAGSSEGEIAELLIRLQELGVTVVAEPQGVSEQEFMRDMGFGDEMYYDEASNDYIPFRQSDESEFYERIEYRGTVENKADLVKLITTDVIEKFGGLNEIVSFKVIGGSIVVNGYYYRCKARDLFARSLPYDLRREIQTGNISRLFDYSQLKGMYRLRDLEFDSTSFVYDYVSYGMGYGPSVSVDRFFDDLPSLQCFCIGRKLFKRSTYMDEIRNSDMFYQPKASTKFANYSEEVLGRASKSSWEFTKNTMKSKDYGMVVKVLGVSAGLLAAGVTLGSRAAVSGGRKAVSSAKNSRGLRGLGQSFKDVFNETKKF